MTSLTDKEREFVAIGAAVGAGCQPCTQYHVRAGLKIGLSQDDVGRAIDAAQALRREGGLAVSNVARRLLGIEEQPSQWDAGPSDRDEALTYIGAAVGCNAGSLLTGYLATATELGLTAEELRSTIELAGVVKERAAEFLHRDVERTLGDSAPAASDSNASGNGCGGPERGEDLGGVKGEAVASTGRASCC